jgi:hypothetical protein
LIIPPEAKDPNENPKNGDLNLTCQVSLSEDQNKLRRLSNREYANTIEDILGINVENLVSEFPPDDLSKGFANTYSDIALSELRSDKYSSAAFRIADAAQKSQGFKDRYLGKNCDLSFECLEKFLGGYLFLIFRSPPSEETINTYRSLHEKVSGQEGNNFWDGISAVVAASLMEPLFLYHILVNQEETGRDRELSQFELASRISYLIWHSSPDVQLLKAAGNNELLPDKNLESMIDRMIESPKAKRAFRSFITEWLSLDNLVNAQRSDAFGAIAPELKEAMKEEVLRYFETHVFSSSDIIKNIFIGDKTFLNSELAKIYGLTPKSDDFEEYSLVNEKHFGILTMAGILTSLSPSDDTSPVKRGFYFSKNFLCNDIPEPPADAGAFEPDVLAEDITPRERFKVHTRKESCKTCHVLVDDFGLAMETYDSIGRFRSSYDNKKAIITAGSFLLDDKLVAITDIMDLAGKVATSRQAKECFVKKVLQYSIGHKINQDNQCEVTKISKKFNDSGKNYRELIKSVVLSETFLKIKSAKE